MKEQRNIKERAIQWAAHGFSLGYRFVYAATFLLAGFMVLLFYQFYWVNAVASLSTTRLQISILERDLQLQELNLAHMAENKRIVESSRASQVRTMPATQETDGILHLGRLLDEFHLTEHEFFILPRETAAQNDRLYRLPLQLSATGTYPDAMNFIVALQEGQYYYLPETLEITVRQIKNEGEILLSVQMFLLLEDEPSTPASTATEKGGAFPHELNPFYYKP